MVFLSQFVRSLIVVVVVVVVVVIFFNKTLKIAKKTTFSVNHLKHKTLYRPKRCT